ncbi:MAG: hypothetical protein ACFFED_17125, partial [Candidatus Thorarchaeota archaeon]
VAIDIAAVEILIDQFADGLYDEMSFWAALIIDVHLGQATRKLDQVFIQLARGHECGAEHLLESAIRDLYETECWIRCLARCDVIPNDLADGMILAIQGFITSLQEIVI